MRTIRLFAALSIDGFLIPYETQQSLDPDFSDYKAYYQNAAIILTSRKGSQKLTKEMGIEKDKIAITYISTSDKSISGDTADKILSSILRQKNRKTGYVAITEDNRKLIALLLEERLVDEMEICIIPVLLGKGKRLFPTLLNGIIWKVKSRQIGDSDITLIHYYKV